jgi:hypothetical protein
MRGIGKMAESGMMTLGASMLDRASHLAVFAAIDRSFFAGLNRSLANGVWTMHGITGSMERVPTRWGNQLNGNVTRSPLRPGAVPRSPLAGETN